MTLDTEADREPNMLRAALSYARHGYRVFPLHNPAPGRDGNLWCSCGKADCSSRAKHPRTEHGVKDATTNEAQIRDWWEHSPEANIGIALTPDMMVLDVDPRAGGDTSLRLLVEKYGQLPETPIVLTGGRGEHYYFRLPADISIGNSKGALGPGLDVKTDGGYVLAPPSLHISGNRYQWELSAHIKDMTIAPAPQWLLERICQSSNHKNGTNFEMPGEISEGARNDFLFRFARSLHARQLSFAEILAALKSVNDARCKPPLDDAEVEQIALNATAEPDRPEFSRQGAPASEPRPWPVLDEAALHGPAGEFVHIIEPHSEADPIALLMQFLAAAGNVAGRIPYRAPDGITHYTNLNAVLAGASSKARKGSSWYYANRFYESVDPEWSKKCVSSGLSSGEGMIWSVRDPIFKRDPIKEHGRVVDYQMIEVDSGIGDKRRLFVESEFVSVLKMTLREGNTLSDMVRKAFDSGNLSTEVKNNPARATNAHISIIGHITVEELLRYFDRTEAANGFGNRFAFCCVRRSKYLSRGGNVDDNAWQKLAHRVARALEGVRAAPVVELSEAAYELWDRVYPTLSADRPGLLGSMLARAEALVCRLAFVYAVLDGFTHVDPEHLTAAVALWEYCEKSVEYIFGDGLGDPVADDILIALRERGDGMTRTEISNMFARNVASDRIDRSLAGLVRANLAERQPKSSHGPERWRPTNTKMTKTTKSTPKEDQSFSSNSSIS